jgi:ribA/ribD-fused uncharacterized protein
MTYLIDKFTGEYSFLSNFYAGKPIHARSLGMHEFKFPTGEHLFQAYKARAMEYEVRAEYIEMVIENPDPLHAKRAGKRAKIDVNIWNAIRINAMENTVRFKFEGERDLAGKLVDTSPAMLIEGNTWGDTFWGRANGAGYNMLGVILMERRAILKEQGI